MMTDLGHLEQAGAGVRRAMSPRISPAAVLRTGYASGTGIAVDEAPLPARLQLGQIRVLFSEQSFA